MDSGLEVTQQAQWHCHGSESHRGEIGLEKSAVVGHEKKSGALPDGGVI